MSAHEAKIDEITRENIDIIEPLWQALNSIHLDRSSNFKNHFSSFQFEDRRKKMLSAENLLILGAKAADELIGYCVATEDEKVGEVESLYVSKEYHGQNIGKELTSRAMDWLMSLNCIELNVYVADGNEIVLPFYEKLGFKKRFSVLQIKTQI